jgi:hypothetical protein
MSCGVIQDCFALTVSNVQRASNQAGILLVLLPFLVAYRQVALQRAGVLFPKAIALAAAGSPLEQRKPSFERAGFPTFLTPAIKGGESFAIRLFKSFIRHAMSKTNKL